MDSNTIHDLMATIELIANNLDLEPESWREHLQTVRSVIASFEILDTAPNEAREQWQLRLITVFRRVAFGDADNGAVQDVADWCLRQELILLHLYPQDVEVLTLIGQHWLMRAQRPLASIQRAEHGSPHSSASGTFVPIVDEGKAAQAFARDEQALQAADYVEARGLLLPAIDYFRQAVNMAQAQRRVTGTLLATAAEAYMSMGNVTWSKINEPYYQQAMTYLREAAELQDYSLPSHLKEYLDENGYLYPSP